MNGITKTSNSNPKKISQTSFRGEPSQKLKLPAELTGDTLTLTTSSPKKPPTSLQKSTAIKKYLTSLKKEDNINLNNLVAIKQQLEKNGLWNINPQNLEIIIYDDPKAKLLQLGFEKNFSHSEIISKIYQELFPNIEPQVTDVFTKHKNFDKEKTLEELTKLKTQLIEKNLTKKPNEPTKTTILNFSFGLSLPKKESDEMQTVYRKKIIEKIFSKNSLKVQKYKYFNAIIEALEEIAQIPNVYVGVSIGNEQSSFNVFALAKGVDVFTGCGSTEEINPNFSTLPPGENQLEKAQGRFDIRYLDEVNEAGNSKGWDFLGTGKPQIKETSSWSKYLADLIGYQHPDTKNVSRITSSDSSRLAIEKFLTGTSFSTPVGLCQKFIFEKIKKILNEM